MKKLAYFSPLRPQASGISDYSEELLPHLANAADITLFVDGFHPVNTDLTSRFEVCDYRRKRSLRRRLEEFDAVVYHMGNDHRYHAGILEAMRKRPGIVVLHDFALQDFFLGLARDLNRPELYLREIDFCYGKEARAVAEESLRRGAVPPFVSQPLEFPLNERIVGSAEGVIVHSLWVLDRLRDVGGVPAVHIPHLVSFDEDIPSVPAPRNDEVRIASFGLITPGKGIELASRALSRLRASHRFRYTIVGEPNLHYDVRRLIRDHKLTDLVEVTGHVSLERFKQYMRETDIALNLRERTVGETSGCLCRLLGLGVCSVVADAGWYGELPADCVVKVPLDSQTDSLLAAYLQRLIEDEPLRTRIGQNARRYAYAHHHVDRSAAAYLDFIDRVISRRTKRAVVAGVASDLVQLGAQPSDEALLQSVAREVSVLLPDSDNITVIDWPEQNGSRHSARTNGRTPKLEQIDYKQAARDYLRNIPEERRHHLRTKPFYNLANKPAKYKNEGMDEDTHRHFCDFANIAVTLALPPGSRILDVGCGSGWLSEYFARLGYVVKGIDISPDLIQMSEERVARVPYGADHETPLRCTFAVHDVEAAPLPEKFDAILCYDSLHHFEDERAVVNNLAAMLDVGGLLFILEGERPPAGSSSEAELVEVMAEFGTLESPFDFGYLRQLLDENGFVVVGDYVSVNGLFQRETIVDDLLPLTDVATNYNYLACKKVVEGAAASSIPDSRNPGLLRANIEVVCAPPTHVVPGEALKFELAITNEGNTLWLAGRQAQLGIVMPAVKIFDASGSLISEVHGEPPLPHAIAPSETMRLKFTTYAPQQSGNYLLKVDLVDQHVCWFEEVGSQPFQSEFAVSPPAMS
ncbi:MAG TPA: methyltransferase domain-containing protein [Pyrinomonadaceae bacterium]|nr:methyltransferase domain-containing protein [Pyrinomonadaceae bacterium]